MQPEFHDACMEKKLPTLIMTTITIKSVDSSVLDRTPFEQTLPPIDLGMKLGKEIPRYGLEETKLKEKHSLHLRTVFKWGIIGAITLDNF